LRKDNTSLGTIHVFRREVRPFSQKQLTLLETFAAQAVIAMENARLLNELRDRTRDLQESLEYQTATSDMLKIISRSTVDLEPVLNSVSATVARLCGADMGVIAIRRGDVYQYVGAFSVDPELERIARPMEFAPSRGTLAGRVILTGQPIHILDIAADPEYTLSQAVSIGRIRTAFGMPLLQEGELIGVIIIARYHMELFTERQLALMRTFADQAVIAIENARLLTETREALEQQTATAEMLQVINSSPGDLTPIFDAMLEKAMRLCDAAFGVFWIVDGDSIRAIPSRTIPLSYSDFLRRQHPLPGPESGIARTLRERAMLHFPDAAAAKPYLNGDPFAVAAVELGGARQRRAGHQPAALVAQERQDERQQPREDDDGSHDDR